MNRPTDEQLIQMANEIPPSKLRVEYLRCMFEASCRIALAEPTDEECTIFGKSRLVSGTAFAIREFLANRLRSLTEPEKDEAVEAVMPFLGGSIQWNREQAAKIVAAVRKADQK